MNKQVCAACNRSIYRISRLQGFAPAFLSNKRKIVAVMTFWCYSYNVGMEVVVWEQEQAVPLCI